MSVVSVKEHHRRRRGSDNEDFTSESERCFTVVTDNPQDDQHDIAASGMIPLVGSLHHKDPGKRCAAIDYDQDAKDYRVWELTHRYTNEIIPGGGIGGDPGSQPFGNVRRTWEPVEVSKQIYFETDGVPIRYSNLRPFTIAKPSSVFRLKVIRDEYQTTLVNAGEFNGSLAVQYHNHVNSDAFSGAPAEQVRLKIKASENIEGGTFIFWTVEYDFEWDPDGWQPSVLNADFYERVYQNPSSETWEEPYEGDPATAPSSSVWKLVPILDRNGEKVTVPHMLDEYGRKIYETHQEESYYVVDLKIYETAAFGDLGLGL